MDLRESPTNACAAGIARDIPIINSPFIIVCCCMSLFGILFCFRHTSLLVDEKRLGSFFSQAAKLKLDDDILGGSKHGLMTSLQFEIFRPLNHSTEVWWERCEARGAHKRRTMRISFRRKKSIAAGTTKSKSDGKKKKKQQKQKRGDKKKNDKSKNDEQADEDVPQTPVKTPSRRKKIPPALRGSTRVRSKEFSSPLVTITESNDEGNAQQTVRTVRSTPSSSVLSSLRVVSVSSAETMAAGDESTEIVYGTPTIEETSSSGNHDEIRKQLFEAKDFPEYQEEDPYDAKMQKEDPTILDIIRSESKDEQEDIHDEEESNDDDDKEEKAVKDEERQEPEAETEDKEITRATAERAAPVAGTTNDVARRLFDAFNCNEDTTVGTRGDSGGLSFYDTLCAPSTTRMRPFFDERFTLNFLQVKKLSSCVIACRVLSHLLLKDGTTIGFPLLLHIPPESEGEDEYWTGQSVTMLLRLGKRMGSQLLLPRLEWSTPGGGSRQGNRESSTTSIGLLDILSIVDSVEGESGLDGVALEEEDLCFFSVTTNEGIVYMFEAVTFEERDRIVNGLKNLLARLSFQVVSGDEALTNELFERAAPHEGELPSLQTKAQHLTLLTHAFLDSSAIKV